MNLPRRPTPEQRARIEAEIRQRGDATPAFLSEMVVASYFLEDLLREHGFPASYIEDRCFTFGRMCFGRDPWQALDKMLPIVEDTIQEMATRKAWADQPVAQDVPAPTPLLEEFWKSAKNFRGEKGVHPSVLIWRDDATPSLMTHMALDLNGRQVFEQAIEVFQQDKPAEMAFGVDMTAIEGQGLEFDDFLAVVWYVDGRFFTGVVDYQKSTDTPPEGETEPSFRPIRWDNNYWNHSLRDYPIKTMLGGPA